MAEILFKQGRAFSLGSIDSIEDLKPRQGISINPPPSDGRCSCCGKHISELKPFGGPGDPLVGDFSGSYLVKIFRPDGPYDEEAELAMKEAEEKSEDPLDWLIAKYGKEKGKMLGLRAIAWGGVGASWECRDCAVLNSDEYFKKLDERSET